MSVKRNDLVAAANAGILHHTEVDTLLVFLKQRDVHERKMGERRSPIPHLQLGRVLLVVAFIGAIGVGMFALLQQMPLM